MPSLDVLARATPQLLSLPVFDTAASRAVHVLMDMIRRQRGRFLPLQVSCPAKAARSKPEILSLSRKQHALSI